MPTRLLRDGINSSRKINDLSVGAELLYRRLLSVVDDYGRFYAEPATVRGACWPAHPGKVTEAQIAEWLEEIASEPEPLILRYQISGILFLQIDKFGQKVRSKSKFPSPDGNSEDKKNGTGNVYFIRSKTSGRIKIGFTELAPTARLSVLQTGSSEPLELIDSFSGTIADERAAHKSFAAERVSGEWFEETQSVREFIAAKCGKMPQTVSKMPQLADKMPQNVGTSRSRNSKTEADANKPLSADAKPATPSTEEVPDGNQQPELFAEDKEPSELDREIEYRAKRIWERHPMWRNVTPDNLQQRLRAATKDFKAALRIAELERIDRRHEQDCNSPKWLESGDKGVGQYATGLRKWFVEKMYNLTPDSRSSPSGGPIAILPTHKNPGLRM